MHERTPAYLSEKKEISVMVDQIPPADELHAVRQQMDQLKQRADALRALLIGDKDSRTGNRYLAIVKNVPRRQFDLAEFRAGNKELADEYTHTVNDVRVELRGLTEDGEIVSTRKVRSTAA